MKVLCCSSLLFLLVACGEKPAPEPMPASPAVAALMLSQPPTEPARAVLAAKQAAAGEAIVVTGRIQSLVKGLAAFSLMDNALAYCGEKHAESCRTPWDYCCESKETRLQHTLPVEARGADGRPLPTLGLGDLRLLDRVSVAGRLETDEHGNLVLIATGWFREQRPQLPENLRWPQ